VFDLDEFVNDCQSALAEGHPQLAVKEVVERAVAEPSAVESALRAPMRGGVDSLHHSAELTILHIVWPPHVRLYPHDHRMWAAIGIFAGREDNVFYRRPQSKEGIVVSGGCELDPAQTLLLGHDVIHAVENPLDSYTAAIHVYGGDFFATPRSQWDPQTFEESAFDVEQLKRVLAEADQRVEETR
jgi:predicted metal-dependent enzyme (double-stranded beta helix superfamily)